MEWARRAHVLPPAHAGVSHSVVNLQRTAAGDGFTAKVDSLASIMATQGHAAIDILKVDIEGAESTVLPASWPRGRDRRSSASSTTSRRAHARSCSSSAPTAGAGYRLVRRERWDSTLVSATLGP